MRNPFYQRDIVDITEFERQELEWLFKITEAISTNPKEYQNTLKNYILAIAFFEPSTRTRISFETAMKRLGGRTVGFSEPTATSLKKGESLRDTLKMLDLYGDLIVIRHSKDGAARYAAEICDHPVISGGDGKFQHPTQTMLDLYTIVKTYGHIDGLSIGVMGDLKYARTVNSFLLGLAKFRPKHIYLISPRQLSARPSIIDYLREKGVEYEVTSSLSDVITELDLLYVVRIQKERIPDPYEYRKIQSSYRITIDDLKDTKEHFRIMHPLPKTNEIDPRIDKTHYALYYEQAKNGVFLRMALLLSILLVDPMGMP